MKKHHVNLIIKPVDELCNLSCEYCNAAVYSPLFNKMNFDMLESIIHRAADNDYSSVRFTWHGGEPLVAGLDFYKTVVTLQNKYFGKFKHHRFDNVVQTNGLLLNRGFLDFFEENDFHLGFSIDGPDVESNHYRFGNKSRPENIMKETLDKFNEVKARGLNLFVIFVVHDRNVHRASDIVKFIREIDANSVSFNPRFNRGDRTGSVEPIEYANFLKQIAQLRNECPNTYFANIDKIQKHSNGMVTNLCYLEYGCRQFLCINSKGDVFATCTDELGVKIGNVNDNLTDMINSISFGKNPGETELSTVPFTYFKKGCPKYSHPNTNVDVYLEETISALSTCHA